ncbi:MAG: putative two-component sensor kinase, partial [Actinomycetia bacterium]|nr:putative two-component sensor kinase [Actinomycetes bacterium]
MGRFATVRVRITLAAVMVVGIGLAAGGIWLLHAQRDNLVDGVETTARLRSRDIAATIADGVFSSSLAVPPGDENIVQVVDQNGAVVATSANARRVSRISTLVPTDDNY